MKYARASSSSNSSKNLNARGETVRPRQSLLPNHRRQRERTKMSNHKSKPKLVQEPEAEETNQTLVTEVPETEETLSIAKPSTFNLDKFKSKRGAAIANVGTL